LMSLACMAGAFPTGTGRDGEMKASPFEAAGVWVMAGVVTRSSNNVSLSRICEFLSIVLFKSWMTQLKPPPEYP
jgi:hypothetical protein